VTVTDAPKIPPMTVSHVFGEITWLLSESVQHRDLRIADLRWLVMPLILNRQFTVFRDGERPLGVALWAYLDEEREKKLIEGMSESSNELRLDNCNCGDRLWLIELVAPFSTNENRQAELMVADLIAGPFAGRSFTMIHTDPASDHKNLIKVDADARDRLIENTKLRLNELGLLK
jgi:cytolysin-activating lysine-acyltransferase